MFGKVGLLHGLQQLVFSVSALHRVAEFLLFGHVGLAYPVLRLSLCFQSLNHGLLHGPRDQPGSSVLPYPLAAGNALSQEDIGQEHFRLRSA